MQHAFRPVREVKSFVGDLITGLKLLLCAVLFCFAVSVIVDAAMANKSGMALLKSETAALPAKARAAAGLR